MTDELQLAKGEIARLTEENADLTRELKLKLRREQQLNHRLAEALGETQAAQFGERVLAFFNAKFSRRLKWVPDGSHARIINRAIRCFDTPEEGVAACREAIEGLAVVPYVVNGKRCATGTERQRYAELHHCLGGDAKGFVDETTIARFVAHARRAREEGLGIPQWGPVVAKEYLDEAVEMCAAKDRALRILTEFCELNDHYITMLERRCGVSLQDTLVAA